VLSIVNLQKLATVVGAAVTTFLLVGVVTIEAVTAAVGGDIGPGIVGVFAGVVTGLAAVVAVSWRWPSLADRARTVLLAYAAFGLTIVFLAALSYVNVPGADAYLGFEVNLVIAAVVAVAAALGRWQTRPRSPAI
jgi:uncharacterized membrane protein